MEDVSLPTSFTSFRIKYSEDEQMHAEFLAILREYGFVLIEDVFDITETNEMRSEIIRIVENIDVDNNPKVTFNASDEKKHVCDKYFLESVDKISHFFEEGAIDPISDDILVPKCKAFNKVGHALHSLNSVFRKFTFGERIQTIVRLIGYRQPKVVQTSKNRWGRR